MNAASRQKKWRVFTRKSGDSLVVEADDCAVDGKGHLRFFCYSDSMDDPEYYQKHAFAPGQWLSFNELED